MLDLSQTTTIYLDPTSILSDAAHMAIKEKGVSLACTATIPEQLQNYQLPIINHNNFIVQGPTTIFEYINDRFPEPPLLPLDIPAKAATRMLCNHVVDNWLPLYRTKRLNDLRSKIDSSAPGIDRDRFFMSPHITFIDCLIAPLLWNLQEHHHIEFCPQITAYAQRLHERRSFQATLTCKARLCPS